MSSSSGRQWSREELIAALQTAIGEGDGPVTQKRYLAAAQRHNASLPPADRLPAHNKAFSDEFGTWAAAVVAAGYQPHPQAIVEHEQLTGRREAAGPSREELIDLLKRFAASVPEGTLSGRDFDRWAGRVEQEAARRGKLTWVPRHPVCREVFGSWRQALRAAGLEDRVSDRMSERGHSSPRPPHSTEEILQALAEAIGAKGGPITVKEYEQWRAKRRRSDGRAPPATSTVVRRLGSWKAAVERAAALAPPAAPSGEQQGESSRQQGGRS